ncbi:ArsR/SmtB family transcription factor [Corynebacterium kroppenstedtii]|uniref:ArsR/SmtB family transcription factor n=1 Tax=Corynebacterium kroppenstedtii TaxID=161879 RepID=UPI001ED8E94C|nr:winged helix-turn-helix domain-containing protein [Corynebacterium kroppenstedtii]
MDMRTFPESLPDISQTAGALADTSRAAMCAALMDGRAWTVGELANYCVLARSTASAHVNILADQGLVVDIHQGRHRYVRLASDEVAHAIEKLGVLTQRKLDTAHSLRASNSADRFRAGRTCYKHFAGRLGVELAEQFSSREYLTKTWELTPTGCELLSTWELPHPDSLTATPCMDSTERRFHIAGSLGKELCTTFFDMGG